MIELVEEETKKVRGMTMEAVAILGLAVAFAAYGLYKYNNSEVNAYNEIVTKVRLLDIRMADLETKNQVLETQSKTDQSKLKMLAEDICEAKALADDPKEMNLTLLHPIQVDIIEKKKPITKMPGIPEKRLMKKLGRKMKGLSL